MKQRIRDTVILCLILNRGYPFNEGGSLIPFNEKLNGSKPFLNCKFVRVGVYVTEIWLKFQFLSLARHKQVFAVKLHKTYTLIQ